MPHLNYPLIFVVFVITNFSISVSADEPAASNPDKHCLGLMQIDDIDIIDSRHIVFQTRNGDYYINQLPHDCPTLSEHKAIMYKTSLNSLCDMDIITVLDYIGGGFQTLGSCGLGTFRPASKAEIETLKIPAE